MLRIAGGFFVLIGLVSAATLGLVPFGLLPITPKPIVWAMFPICFVGGTLLIGLGTDKQNIRSVYRACGAALFVLGLLGAGGVAVDALGVFPASGGTASLWFLFGAGVLGGALALIKPDYSATSSSQK